MPVQDQVVWQSVNVAVRGRLRTFKRGELLPPPADDKEANLRALARLGGALKVVEVVRVAPDPATRTSPAQAAAMAGIPASPSPGTTPGPAPAAEAAAPAAGESTAPPVVLGPPPPAHGSKRDWVDYAVTQGMDRAEAEGMGRDQLAQHYRGT
jgi:hypothetical protein